MSEKYLWMNTSPQDRLKFCNYLNELGEKLYKNIIDESFFKPNPEQPIQYKNVYNYEHYDLEYLPLFD